MFFLPALPFLLVFIIVNHIILALGIREIALLAVMTFFFSFLGNKYSFLGIKTAPNPGYSLIIQKSYAIYTAFVAIWLFNAELTAQAFLAILMIILFSASLMIDQSNIKKVKSTKWVIYSLLAFFLFGNLVLSSKYLQNAGVNPWAIVFYIFSMVSILFGIDLYRDRKKINLSIKKSVFWLLPLIGISNGFFNVTMQLAYKSAPNIGYVNIINASSITVITVLSMVFFKDKLNVEKIIGILGVTLGLILLIIL